MNTCDLAKLIGAGGEAIRQQRIQAMTFLRSTPPRELLKRIGQTIPLPGASHLTKALFQKSYATHDPDLVAALGLFFTTEDNRLFLDCTSGHYQMVWGYNHPGLNDTIRQCLDEGIVWDTHANTPGDPVKRLADVLVALCNGEYSSADHAAERYKDSPDRLNRVNLGTATGTAACSTAIKIALRYYEGRYMSLGAPVIVTHVGNYHGTDIFTQRLRGMWTSFFDGCRVEFVSVEPNDRSALRQTFRRYGKRCALCIYEPIMMNREALLVERETVQLIRELCDETDALMAVDEIQTGFWQPEVFSFRQFDVTPDVVIAGKGMTAGFHPLSATIFKAKFDNLQQYDSLNTNGSAPLAASVALANIALIAAERERIRRTATRYFEALTALADEFPEKIECINGSGHLAGIKFHDREAAIATHRACVASGLWLRVHAYHEGHSTLLTKFGLLLDEETVDCFIERLRTVLAQ